MTGKDQEKYDEIIKFADYLSESLTQTNERLTQTNEYVEYLTENLDRSINYSESIAKKLSETIGYIEHLESNDYLSFGDYLKLEIED